MAKREEKDIWKRINKAAGILTTAGFLIFAVYLFSPKFEQYKEYKQRAAKLEADVEALQEQITEIQKNRHNFVQDKNYARRVAHEQGFAEEGEIIYKFMDEPAP